MQTENYFYNAAAVSLGSDYSKLRKLKEKFGNWENAWKSLERAGTDTDPEAEWAKLQTTGVALFLPADKEFPALLKEIPLAPFGIYVRGNLPAETDKVIGIVGTRKATPDGVDMAYEFGRALAAKGVWVASGLALGMDAAAHKGALTTGKTLAVLATGVDKPYPNLNKKLAEDILACGGALISEYPPGSPPLPYKFLERNRIVSGLSLGTVVIEAPKNSGSLVTARFALDQNREVFVVPGPAMHINYSGSHALIREGARLVCHPEEVLEDLGLAEETGTPSLFQGSEEEQAIMALVNSSGPIAIDEIIELTRLETANVVQVIGSLLIANKIKETEHGYQIV